MNKLKILRKEKNVSQKEIAQILNISQNGYSQYETETRIIPIILLTKLSGIYQF